MQRAETEVTEHMRNHLVDEIVLVRYPFEETSRRGLSLQFVAVRRDPSNVGCDRPRLAEIVTEYARPTIRSLS